MQGRRRKLVTAVVATTALLGITAPTGLTASDNVLKNKEAKIGECFLEHAWEDGSVDAEKMTSCMKKAGVHKLFLAATAYTSGKWIP